MGGNPIYSCSINKKSERSSGRLEKLDGLLWVLKFFSTGKNLIRLECCNPQCCPVGIPVADDGYFSNRTNTILMLENMI